MLLLALSLALFSSAVAFCPEGAYYEQNSGKCFQAVLIRFNFTDAEANCQKLGGHLASIHNIYENVHIQSYTQPIFDNPSVDGNSQFWLGYNILHSSDWQWTDNSSNTYNNWRYNNPANPWTEKCTEMYAGDGLWDSDFCTDLLYSLCEVPATAVSPTGSTPKPPQCLEEWRYLAATDSCYLVNQADATPDQHDAYCQVYGARLTSIHSAVENSFVFQINQYAVDWPVTCYKFDVWTGLKSDGNNWTWLDGTPLDYTNFVNGTSSTKGRKMCMMQGTAKADYPKQWYIEPCSYSVCGVCKMKANPV